MARLVLIQDGKVREYELQDETILGRSSKNTIRLEGGKASREHSKISKSGEDYQIEDLNSSNGTYVNGKKISSAQKLKAGDFLGLGGSDFYFVAPCDDELVGTRLADYYIISKLGSGGMGDVYFAKQVSMERDVALKIMHPRLAKNPEFIKNFMREAQLAGRLNHPNVIHIHDFGCEGARYFFSMELARGKDLKQIIDESGPLSIDKLRDVCAQVAEGLAHAHSHGITHQDIKPHNIIMTDEGQIKLADLGIAKVMQYGGSAIDSRPAMGTPQYVAPEVVRHNPPDPRSDIYSLGATMYHMATGKPPFDGEKPTSIVKMHLDKPTPDPRRLCPEMPPELGEFIMTAMSKDPARRPADCTAFAGQLREMALSEKGKAKPASEKKPAMPLMPEAKPKTRVPRERDAFDTDGTDAFHPVNKWKPVAISIMVLCSVVVAALAAWGISASMRAKRRNTEASTLLAEARRLLREEDTPGARENLDILIKDYSDLPEGKEADTLLSALKAQKTQKENSSTKELGRIEEWIKSGILTPAEAEKRIAELLEKDRDPALAAKAEALRASMGIDAATKDSGGEGDKTLEKWNSASSIIRRKIDDMQFADASEMLNSFIRNYEGTPAAQKAKDLLREMNEKAGREMGKILASANESRDAGRLSEAREGYAKILSTFPSSSWAKQAGQALDQMDRASFVKLGESWQATSSAFKTLRGAAAIEKAQKTLQQLIELELEDTAKDLLGEARAIEAFHLALVNKIRKGTSEEVGVAGMGICKLSISDDGFTPYATIGKEKPVAIDWSRIGLEDMAELLPADSLSEDENLGAALFFLGQKHLGYARTYLKRVDIKGPLANMVWQTLAHREGRLIVGRYDFEDTDPKRWKTVKGNWSYKEGSYFAEKANISQAVLSGQKYPLSNFSVNFSASALDPEGEAGIALCRSESEYIALRRSATQAIIEFRKSRNDEPARKNIVLNAQTKKLKLVVKNGNAEVVAGKKTLDKLSLAQNISGWWVDLRLEASMTSAVFDDIVIEAEPPRK